MSRIDTHQRSINTAETKARRGNVISVKSLDAIIEGQGRKGWVKEEAKMIFKLMILPEYCHTKGPAKIGSPNYEKIAKFLNQQYHQGAPVRYRNSVANKVREELKKESNV